MPVIYLTPPEVIALHHKVLTRMGGHPAPLRSEDLLESAIQRAQTAAYYGDADIVVQGCLMAIGISQNQPFLDGNKRTALFSLIVFLRQNGLTFTGKPLDIAAQLVAVSEREGTLDDATEVFAVWVRAHTARS
jgi:death-on-curing protein